MGSKKASAALLDPLGLFDARELVRIEERLSDVEASLKRLEEALSVVEPLVRFYEEYGDCYLERTWVKNKVGDKYYYYYLKCRDKGGVRSIYLGKEGEALTIYNEVYRPLITMARRISELKARLTDLANLRNELRRYAEEIWKVSDGLRETKRKAEGI
ncbi:MAG: hypothetical protein RXO25_02725 [Caldivirga sp.]|jgi:hypothetical protein